jgi:hypothetical protein
MRKQFANQANLILGKRAGDGSCIHIVWRYLPQNSPFLLNTILGKSVERKLILALRMAISPAQHSPFFSYAFYTSEKEYIYLANRGL